jgi:hypothetical protein
MAAVLSLLKSQEKTRKRKKEKKVILLYQLLARCLFSETVEHRRSYA